MDKLVLTVAIESGRCQWSPMHLQQIRAYLGSVKGAAVSVSFAKPKSVRSMKAHRYYFGVVLTTIATETGNDVADLHEAYKLMFIPPVFVKLGSKEIEVRRTTTDLPPEKFNRYVEDIIIHAGRELGITIPPPN